MSPSKPPRQRKTPRQRAEETLALAVRKHDRLVKDATVPHRGHHPAAPPTPRPPG